MTDPHRLALAPQGVFRTIQGEGLLLGVPMVFVRLAGCSVGCPECDTDYRVHERLTAGEVSQRISACQGSARHVWITGGEPGDQHPALFFLVEAIRRLDLEICLATSAQKPTQGLGWMVDFLSVSPHGKPGELYLPQIRNERREQINLVPGLNGLRLSDWEGYDDPRWSAKYVTPMWHESPFRFGHNVEECVDFVGRNPGWRLGVQAHKTWGLP